MKHKFFQSSRAFFSTIAAADHPPSALCCSSHEKLQEILFKLENGSLQGNPTIYSGLLRSCGRIGTLAELRRIHSKVSADGFLQDSSSLGRHIVQMYIRFGSLIDAHSTFRGIANKQGVVLWTAMISGYVKEGQFREAISMFEEMQRNHVIPDKVTFVSLLGAFEGAEQLDRARIIHTRIAEAGYESDLVVGNALVKMYVNCCSLEDARKVFEGMPHRDVVSWTAMIAANAQIGHFDTALLLFRRMQLQGCTPNRVTLLALLSSCEDLKEGAEIHERAFASGLRADVAVCNAILNMYAKCGHLELSRKLFDRMPVRNTVSWTAMIAASVKHGDTDEALKLFRDMQDELVEADWITFITVLNACGNAATARWIHGCIIRSGYNESDTVVGNAILKTYARCGSLKEACRTFTTMSEKDHVSWTAMISAYADFGRLKKALQLFREMQLEGFKPNEVTLITMANACANATAPKEGKMIHGYVSERGLESNSMLATALLNMYGKCGSLESASNIFGRLQKPDVVSWTSMVSSYAQNGDGAMASKLFGFMQLEGVRPVDVTFVSIVSACSHAGLVNFGCDFFSSMIKDHCIPLLPEHCGCMVDLFGRAGRLEEAEYLIDSMPFKPTPNVWMAFLAACKMHDDIPRGQRAAAQILGLDAKTTAAVIALSNDYTASGRAGDADMLRKLIAEGCLDNQLISGS